MTRQAELCRLPKAALGLFSNEFAANAAIGCTTIALSRETNKIFSINKNRVIIEALSTIIFLGAAIHSQL